jgi:hypothetical protein
MGSGDGGFWFINVEGAASGNEFHWAWRAIVVSDMKRNRDAVETFAAAALDCEKKHPDNVPKPSGFVLAGHVQCHGHITVRVNNAGQVMPVSAAMLDTPT